MPSPTPVEIQIIRSGAMVDTGLGRHYNALHELPRRERPAPDVLRDRRRAAARDWGAGRVWAGGDRPRVRAGGSHVRDVRDLVGAPGVGADAEPDGTQSRGAQ